MRDLRLILDEWLELGVLDEEQYAYFISYYDGLTKEKEKA